MGWHDYYATAWEVMEDGCTISGQKYCSLLVAMYTPLPATYWGFRAEFIREDAEKIGWPDKDLLESLLYGFGGNVEGTRRVWTDSPHQKAARIEDQNY